MDIKVKKGILSENIHQVMEWTNERGQAFLAQWAGTAWKYPLSEEQISAEKDVLFSILEGNKFVGIMQTIRREGDNIHMGRFILEPGQTGKGIGTEALQQYCKMIFAEKEIATITLNVYEFNVSAQRCYEKVGFSVVAAVAEEGQLPYRKMKIERKQMV